MTSEHLTSKKSIPCRYFIKSGSCNYGNDCQFSHDMSKTGLNSVEFQSKLANGFISQSTRNSESSDMLGNNGDQYFTATFDSENGANEFHPFSGGMSRSHRSLMNQFSQHSNKPNQYGQSNARLEGPAPGMDRPPPGQMTDGYGPRVGGMPSHMGQKNARVDQSLPSDFAALNLSIPNNAKGPNPVANEFIPRSGQLTHSVSSPNFSSFSEMLPDTSTAPPNSHLLNNQPLNQMGNPSITNQMNPMHGHPPSTMAMMNSHPMEQMSNTPPPTHLNTVSVYSTASPIHSPHLSPSNSPLMVRRTASPIAPLKTSSTPKKLSASAPTIQENVGGTTYFYRPEDFSLKVEGAALPNFSMFPSLPPHIAHLTVKKNMPQFFMPDELRMEILNRNALTMAQIDPELNPDIPVEVDTYHNLFPLEPPLSAMQKSNRFGYLTTCYKAINTKDGLTYCLRRVHSFRLSNTKCMSIIDMWKKMYHPNIVQLREVFTTKAFGDNSIVFVYDFFSGAETLMSRHFNGPQNLNSFYMDSATRPYNTSSNSSNSGNPSKNSLNGPRQHAGLLPESLIWAYVVQLSSALRAVHAAGLACRMMDPTKILIYSKSRLRLNCVGILDVLTFDTNQASAMAVMQHYQQEDLVLMGRVVLALACNSMMAVQRDNFQNSMELIARNYSADLKNFCSYLLTNQNRPRSINDIMPMIGARFYTQLDAAQLRSDVIETELAKEVENGRLFRLMCKLGAINDRPEFNLDPQWSETGDRYMLKLFRDYMFHQVDENGQPWIDVAHILQCLNKFDAGVPEKICLMSRDEHTVLVVSYAELKNNFEHAFKDLLTTSHSSVY